MKKLYESKEAAGKIGIPERTLRYWATIGVLNPAVDAVGRPGIRRKYDERNIKEGKRLKRTFYETYYTRRMEWKSLTKQR